MGKKTMKSDDGKVTTSGIKAEGSWEQICDFSEDIGERFVIISDSDTSRQKFDEWRPKREEDKKDVHKRTAEKASMDTLGVEKDYEGTKKEFKLAVESMKDNESSTSIKKFINHLGRIVSTGILRVLRWFETEIYDKLMLKFNPYYLDTEEFSVNLQHKKDDRYIMKVNVLDEDKREKLQQPVREDRR